MAESQPDNPATMNDSPFTEDFSFDPSDYDVPSNQSNINTDAVVSEPVDTHATASVASSHTAVNDEFGVLQPQLALGEQVPTLHQTYPAGTGTESPNNRVVDSQSLNVSETQIQSHSTSQASLVRSHVVPELTPGERDQDTTEVVMTTMVSASSPVQPAQLAPSQTPAILTKSDSRSSVDSAAMSIGGQPNVSIVASELFMMRKDMKVLQDKCFVLERKAASQVRFFFLMSEVFGVENNFAFILFIF
jgi:hypothetical protein